MLNNLPTRWAALLLAVLLAGLPCAYAQQPRSGPNAAAAGDAKKARKLFAQAQEAERAEDWARAFDLYSLAVAEMPSIGEYLMRREAARFQIVQAHMDRAEHAALAGNLPAARAELQAALALDPGYSVARERLAQLQAPRPQKTPDVPQFESALPQLRPQPGKRTFNYTGESRKAYEEVAKQFGLTASFDPDLRDKEIRFRVEDVDFFSALHVLGRLTNTFWRALDQKSFLVADNTPQKRRELAPVVVRTLSLSELTSPEQMTEIVRLVREITGIQRTQLNTRTRTLTVRDSPEAVALAARLVDDLEQAVGEMTLEVEILEVDREVARRLGITPPTAARTFTVTPQDIRDAQQSPEALIRIIQRIFGSSSIPPLVAFGGGRSVLLATLPGATAEFADAFTLLRRGRRTLLRAQDGQPATFFIGERFPIALATLSPNFAGTPLGNVGDSTLVRTDLQAGDGPASVLIADFNGDTFPDVVVANANTDSVTVFLANGDGTFDAGTPFPAGASPAGIVAGDFNGDTRLDLAVTNETAATVSILIGNGDGTFSAPSSFPTGTAPRGIAAGNLSTDSFLDLVVANSGSNTVSVLLGNGTGAFATRTDFAVGNAPQAVAIANFDAATALDIAVANRDSDTVTILFGDGAGGFPTGVTLTAGNGPVALAVADFNSDNTNDLAVANEEADTVSVFLGIGDGTFSGGGEFVVGDGPSAVLAADFTLDGRPDLVVANRNVDTFTVLLGDGTGTFAVRLDFDTGDGPAALASTDLNNDGRRDLVVANRDADTISIVLNQISLLAPGSPFSPQTVQPYPSFQYEDLGLKIRATPRLHPGSEVTLQLQFEIRSRTGQTLNSIPVISNRTLEQTVRVREGETTVLTGILQQEDRLGISGWPGFSHVPGAGRASSRRETNRRETELIISITPRRIRLAQRIDRQIYAGPEGSGAAPPPPQ